MPRKPCPHCDVKIIQRSNRQSAVASVAYARADAEMKRKALETANLDLPAESQTSWQKDQSLLS